MEGTPVGVVQVVGPHPLRVDEGLEPSSADAATEWIRVCGQQCECICVSLAWATEPGSAADEGEHLERRTASDEIRLTIYLHDRSVLALDFDAHKSFGGCAAGLRDTPHLKERPKDKRKCTKCDCVPSSQQPPVRVF